MGITDPLRLRTLAASMQGFARVHVLRTGVTLGLFDTLRRPRGASDLASELGLEPDLVEAWMHSAEALGVLRKTGDAFVINGFSRWLIEAPEASALHGMLDQVVYGWGPQFEALPRLLKGAERRVFGTPEEATRTAVAARAIEARAIDALVRVPGARHAHRVLDIGCGHGSYLAGFLARHRDASGLGVELDAAVADEARRHLREAEVSRRAEVHVGDFLTLELPAGSWDLAMMNNNLYYFAPADRPALFARARARLTPGGVLAIQLPVAVRDPFSRWLGTAASGAIFDLFLRSFRNLHGLPDPATLHAALHDAGFVETGEVSILPGGGARYFWARSARS